MAVTAPTTAPRELIFKKPSRLDKLRESLGILTSSKVGVFGLFLVLFWVFLMIFADNCVVHLVSCLTDDTWESTPWLARYSPLEQFRGENLEGPSAKHWLGTDKLGRDLHARLVHGARKVLTLAPFSVLLSLAIGGTLGVIAGYKGGLIDEVIMRGLDAMMAFPTILLYLVIIAALGASAINIIIAITLGGLPGIARLVRGLTLDIKTRDYVAAAETRGESSLYIMLVEILPNARGPIIVDVMLRIGYAIFGIGALGFLGLGLPPPAPDWGTMVSTGMRYIQAGHPWPSIWGSIAIASIVVGLNLMADGMNEELNRYR